MISTPGSNNYSYVSIVGGANIDIQGFPYETLKLKDSNPGKVKVSPGGVGRNIGENLSRLGINIRLISILGDDIYGRKILEQASHSGLNMDDSLILEGHPTSSYLCILDENGDMAAAISGMEIYDSMTVDFIKTKTDIINNSELCIIDTNLPCGIIDYIVNNCRDTTFFLDTVSTTKAMKVKDIMGFFHTVKANLLEAEALTGMDIGCREDLKKASYIFLGKGVQNIFITMGGEGVFYSDGTHEELFKVPKINAINSTGAGDAFTAALAYGYMNKYEIDYAVRFACGASILALSHEDTINPNMSVNSVIKIIKEMGLC